MAHCEANTTSGRRCRGRIDKRRAENNTVRDSLGFVIGVVCGNHLKALWRGKSVGLATGGKLVPVHHDGRWVATRKENSDV